MNLGEGELDLQTYFAPETNMTFPVKSTRSVVGSNVGADEESGHIVVQ